MPSRRRRRSGVGAFAHLVPSSRGSLGRARGRNPLSQALRQEGDHARDLVKFATPDSVPARRPLRPH
eukprot:2680389-Lingulodinium_polyedra.AAC.1